MTELDKFNGEWAAMMAEKARLRRSRDQQQASPAKTLACIQLTLWPEAVRGIPNAALRSALFGAVRMGARPYLERQKIHSQEGIAIHYTGARLDQADLDVWSTVLHIARVQSLGTECRVTAYQLLKSLGKTDSGKNRDTLSRRLSRLNATGLDVKIGHHSYEGSLIAEVYRDEVTLEYFITLSPKLVALFGADQFTQVEWAIRHALDGKPLSQWLHGFYSSHAKPYPMSVQRIYELCGSQAALISDFKKDLKRSLDHVVEACSANGQRFRYEFKNNLVFVKHSGSPSQQRHIAKRVRALKQQKR